MGVVQSVIKHSGILLVEWLIIWAEYHVFWAVGHSGIKEVRKSKSQLVGKAEGWVGSSWN